MYLLWPKQPTDPIHFCARVTKFKFLYLIPVISAGFFVHSLWQIRSSPLKALLYVHIFVSGGRQLCSLLYPVRQLHLVCRMNAEEDERDFRQLRPGLDSPQATFFASTLKKLLCIFRQCISLVPSLKALSRFQHINWSNTYSIFTFVCTTHGSQN